MADQSVPLDLRSARKLAKDQTKAVQTPAKTPTFIGPTLQMSLKYRDPLGEAHEADLTLRVMQGADDRAEIGRLQAMYAGGLSFSALPPDMQLWATAMATVAVLVDPLPDWLSRWIAVDEALLAKIWAALREHERLFFRSGPGAGPNAEGERVVALAPELDAARAAASKQDRPD